MIFLAEKTRLLNSVSRTLAEQFFWAHIKEAVVDVGAVIKTHYANVDLSLATSGHNPGTTVEQFGEYLAEAGPLGDYAAEQFEFCSEQ